MKSPIHNLALIQRNPIDHRVDVKSSLQIIAKELLAMADEEKRIRNSRRYKAAIRRAFKAFGTNRLPSIPLVMLALAELKAKPDNFEHLRSELEQHIRFNRGGYLRTIPGKAGGVELAHP